MVHKQTSEPNDSFSGKNIVCVCVRALTGEKNNKSFFCRFKMCIVHTVRAKCRCRYYNIRQMCS